MEYFMQNRLCPEHLLFLSHTSKVSYLLISLPPYLLVRLVWFSVTNMWCSKNSFMITTPWLIFGPGGWVRKEGKK